MVGADYSQSYSPTYSHCGLFLFVICGFPSGRKPGAKGVQGMVCAVAPGFADAPPPNRYFNGPGKKRAKMIS